ncbi:MAG: hypothetical protein Q9174_000961 [Haloplaca sp. 1 TL-2023]
MTKKRPRESSSIDTRLVEIYDDLAHEDEEIRLKAAHAFLIRFSVNGSQSSQQISEAVRRLIRGLCSGRKAARLGFSIALTELLSQRWGEGHFTPSDQVNTEVTTLIEILKKQTEITGNVSGQEERDHLFGRLFCAEAFIKSGILFHKRATIDAWSMILDVVFEAAKKTSWLREECGWVLYEAVQTATKMNCDVIFVQNLIDKLCQNRLARTPEGVAIWLKVQASCPRVILPDGVWRKKRPLHPKEKAKLAKILREAPSRNPSDEQTQLEERIAHKGNWNSKVHFVWNVILSELISQPPVNVSDMDEKIAALGEFWQEAVDASLFASSSTAERKYWGFLLFQQVFSTAHADFLPALFTENFLRCLGNQLANKERYLHRAAEKTKKLVLDRAEAESAVADAALGGLLSASSPNGSNALDQLSRTKIVERLIALANDASLNRHFEQLHARLVRPGTPDEKMAASKRQAIIDQLASFIKSRQSADVTRSPSNEDFSTLTVRILQVFAKYSYFSVDPNNQDSNDDPRPPMSDKNQDTMKSRLSSCLTHVVTKFKPAAYFTYSVVDGIRAQHAEAKLHSVLDLSSSMQQTMASAWIMLEHVHQRAGANGYGKGNGLGHQEFLQAFKLLCSLTIIQLYNGDADALSMLGELQDWHEKSLGKDNQIDQHGTEILIQIILSFVAKPSQLFRQLAQQVFSVLASHVEQEGLYALAKVLETKEDLPGQTEMFDEDDELSEIGSQSTKDSDVEEVTMKDVDGVESSSSPSDGEDEGSEDVDASDKEAAEELAAFDLKLAQALRTRPLNGDAEATDDAQTLSDEDMDDEQMEALDSHIATIFREKKKAVNKKTQKKDAKETIVNFKCRVLDLLEVFVKQRHKASLTFDILLPLLTVIRTTTSRLVSGKACGVMREYSKLCKGKEVPRIKQKQVVLELLKDVHIEAMLESSKVHASACSQASLLLVKALAADDRENLWKVVKIYAHTQGSMLMDPKCKVKNTFFTEWQNWCSTARVG